MWTELSDLKDKKILVVGLGKTGVSLAKFLTKHEAIVTVTDHKSKPELSTQLDQLEGYTNIKFELGSHSPKTFLSQDLVILSPGVASHLKIFEYARQQGVKITGEFEFSSAFIKEPIAAVTGTNGKTTVARLAEAMLKDSGVEVWVGGSNENPITNYLLEEKKAKLVIAEVSGF
ncbi:MAG: Mur ligase family protein, partial [Pseudobdellovibrio sp.]